MDKWQPLFDKVDAISDQLAEVHRYKNGTALLIMILWGLGLPLVFLIAINVAVRL